MEGDMRCREWCGGGVEDGARGHGGECRVP